MTEYRLVHFGNLAKFKILWHFKIFVDIYTESYGARNFKTLLLLQFFIHGSFGELPRIKNFVVLSNFNMWPNGKILKCAISWKRLIVELSGVKFRTHIPMHCILVYIGCFHVWFFEFSLGSFDALCKIHDVKTFKRLTAATLFLSNFNQTLEKECNWGKYSLLPVLFWQTAKF